MEIVVELYLHLAIPGPDAENVAYKRDTLLYLLGAEGRRIFKTLAFDKVENDRTAGDIIKAFDVYCAAAVNVDMERHHFLSLKQEISDSYDIM